MASFIYIKLLFLFSSMYYVICELNLSEGSACVSEGVNGTCVSVYRCQRAAIIYIYSNAGFAEEFPQFNEICRYKDGVPIVCCTDCAIYNEEKYKDYYIDIWKNFKKKSGSKSFFSECLTSGRYPFKCLQFELPPDVEPEEVNVVELWFYKEKDPLDDYNQTFVISEAAHWDSQQQFKKTKPIAIKETDIGEGWVRVELAWAVRVWLEGRERLHTLHVACRTCQLRRSPLSFHEKHRPFLVLYTKYAGKRRHGRAVDCSATTSECCREPLFVSFKELGWDDWIIRPAGYHAYFCKGTCAPISAAASSGATNHQHFLRKLFYSVSDKKFEFKPCCAPTTFSSLQLLYMDSTNTVTQKTLPNMVVESCGCM